MRIAARIPRPARFTRSYKRYVPDHRPNRLFHTARHPNADQAGSPNRPSPVSVGDTTRWIFLILAAFSAGAAVMIVELTGNRILAPWFGNSLYTWTGLIGVILMSISCGYYLGGYLGIVWGPVAATMLLFALPGLLLVTVDVVEIDPAAVLLGSYLDPTQYDTSAGVIFTDDYNPVEYLVAKSLATP